MPPQTTPQVSRLKTFRVVGVFEVGMYEYDSGLALIHLDDAARFFRVEGPTGVQLRLRDEAHRRVRCIVRFEHSGGARCIARRHSWNLAQDACDGVGPVRADDGEGTRAKPAYRRRRASLRQRAAGAHRAA